MVSDHDDRVKAIMDRALTELAELMAVEADGTCLATNWVLVIEWSTVDGKSWLSRWWDEDRPIWQRDGLLHAAIDANWARIRDDDDDA